MQTKSGKYCDVVMRQTPKWALNGHWPASPNIGVAFATPATPPAHPLCLSNKKCQILKRKMGVSNPVKSMLFVTQSMWKKEIFRLRFSLLCCSHNTGKKREFWKKIEKKNWGNGIIFSHVRNFNINASSSWEWGCINKCIVMVS